MTQKSEKAVVENTAANTQEGAKKSMLTVKDVIEYLVTLGIGLVLLTQVFCLGSVPSKSMEPTVHAHSIIFGWRLPYAVSDPEPKRGEIVIFKDEEERGVLMIKRVIGLSGDTIEIKEGHVFVNGEEIDEEYLPEGTVTSTGNVSKWEVPEGHCFVMGDNRGSSFDSRYRTHTFIPYNELHSKYLFAVKDVLRLLS